MKNNFWINAIIIYILLMLPVNVHAEDDVNNIANENNYKANVTVKYNKVNQIDLENIPEIGCKAVYVAEPTTGKIIYEKNAHEKMYPASTTKILTALVVLENCKLTDTAIVSQKALSLVPSGYSNAKLQEGEVHTIKDLLYALLLPSANEAANVLAEHVSGSVEAFANLCNTRAKELGCENLHFVNPNGIHNENHYCTAYDLYLVAKECRKYEAFNEIVKTKTYTLHSTSKYPGVRTIKNTNELLLPGTYYYSYCTGIKTGFTTPAGQCLVASSSCNNIDVISVVLGGGTNSQGLNERFSDTKKLFEFVYNNYSIKTIAEHGDTIASVFVGKATRSTANLDAIVDTDISTIVPNNINKENIQVEVSMDENIIAPITQNQVLGQITYYADGLNYTTNIIASHPVEKLPYARYNTTVIISLSITLTFFVVILIIFKKHRKGLFIAEIIFFVAVCIVVSPFIKKDMKNKIPKITPAENIILTDQKI